MECLKAGAELDDVDGNDPFQLRYRSKAWRARLVVFVGSPLDVAHVGAAGHVCC